MYLLRIVFIVLSLVSVACAVRGAMDKRRKPINYK